MRVRAITSTGDWTFGAGANNYKSANDAIAQNIQTRLSSFLGNCFFDLRAGIDWFNLLGSKDQVALNQAVTTVILNTFGVTALKQISITRSSNRSVTIKYEVTTIYTGVILPSTSSSIVANTNYILTESGDVIVTENGDPIITEGP